MIELLREILQVEDEKSLSYLIELRDSELEAIQKLLEEYQAYDDVDSVAALKEELQRVTDTYASVLADAQESSYSKKLLAELQRLGVTQEKLEEFSVIVSSDVFKEVGSALAEAQYKLADELENKITRTYELHSMPTSGVLAC